MPSGANPTVYTVLNDDNFQHLDPAHRAIHGEPTAGAAIAACKVIVERSLTEQCEQGMTVDQLFGAFQLLVTTHSRCQTLDFQHGTMPRPALASLPLSPPNNAITF